ncbi:hypothetical protein KP509_34G047900 [Ceratopteris richardii]|nr:hypothetical protein KP509_34G047900 [Ceratopteris richardii]
MRKNLDQGRLVHAHCVKTGSLTRNVYLDTALLDMYAKCGALEKAQLVFEDLSEPDTAIWNVLISAYVEHGLSHEALHCLEGMQKQGISPSAITYVFLLKACGRLGALQKGEQLHVEASRKGLLENNTVLRTALVDMYAKCGALVKCQEAFDELPSRDVVSWNALISGYVQYGFDDKVMECFQHMRHEGLKPDVVTYICVLKACAGIKDLKVGEEIHHEVSKLGWGQRNILLGTALVDMYSECSELGKARQVFDDLPARDVPLWNALISGYVQHGFDKEALDCYGQMCRDKLPPNPVTFVSVLKACGNLRAADQGKEVHAEICRQGLLEKDVVLVTALVDMYASCGQLPKARAVFDEFPNRDVTSWTALINAYIQQNQGEEALRCLESMYSEGLSPNAVTFACILKACGSIGAVENGKKIHMEIDRQGLLKKSSVLCTALVDMYAKCGLLAIAQNVLDNLPSRDVTCWTALMSGYAQYGLIDEALLSYERMRDEGLSPDLDNFLCIVRTCGSLGAVRKGDELYTEIDNLGLLDRHAVLGIVLIDMYAKCGALTRSREVFNKLTRQDVVSWTALIAGYTQFGMTNFVFDLFNRMRKTFVEPNEVTFIVLLNACSHAGLVEEGKFFFKLMCTVYKITPTLEHYTCMVDLFFRAGDFNYALSLIERVPSSDYLLLWLSLLNASGRWANINVGELAFECAMQLDENCAATYAFTNNLYAAIGMQQEAGTLWH